MTHDVRELLHRSIHLISS